VAVTNDSATSKVCTPKLVINGTTTSLNTVTYTSTKTPVISSIVPRYGKVSGNEVITITGTNFVNGSTFITIDGVSCTPQTITANQITCLTGSRPFDEPNPSFIVRVNGLGIAATQGNTFKYV
jgi:hypothetical protein